MEPPTKGRRAAKAMIQESRPWKLLVLAAVLLVVDFCLGPYIQFPVFFVIPVMLIAWYYNTGWAVAVAVAMAVGRFAFHWYWKFPMEVMPAAVNTVMRGIILVLIAYVTASTALLVRRLRQRVADLEAQLPVCEDCGLIQSGEADWVDAHELKPRGRCFCPTCEEKRYSLRSVDA